MHKKVHSIIFFLLIYCLLFGHEIIGQTNIIKTWWSPKDVAGVSYKFDSSGVVKFHSFTCLSQFNRTGHYTVSKDSIFITFDSLAAEEKNVYHLKINPPTGDTLYIIDNHKIQVNEYIYIYDKIVERPVPYMPKNKTVGITFDSIIAYCELDDIKKFINWEYSDIKNLVNKGYDNVTFSYTYEMEILDSLYKIKKDTVLITGDGETGNYEGTVDWLVRKNSIIFYDKVNKKFVRSIRKQKLKIKNEAIYIIYSDKETDRRLWTFQKKDLNPQKF